MDLKANVKNAHGLDRPVSELSDQEILVLADEYVMRLKISLLEQHLTLNHGLKMMELSGQNTSKLADEAP